ncbi:MAG TPA: DUF2846 domain-containing protein [Stellaceae bacterium]|nr:DUF2846 domain-containing protein [Stellaceae bacterium]
MMSIARAAKTILAGLCLMLLAACASGPKFSEVQEKLAARPADSGRIYVYRTAIIGAAVQPAVKLNGEVIGSAVPQGFFYVDRPAGTYEVSTATEVTRNLSLTLEPGQTRYVRLGISIGFVVGHVYPELVDDTVGSAEIQQCHYVASK